MASRSNVSQVIFLQSAERLTQGLFRSCIYVIRHSASLEADYASGGKGEFTEGKSWVKGSRILQEAHQARQVVPVLFAQADADISSGMTYWALIDYISATRNDTTVRFSSLQPLPKKWPLSSLTMLSSGKPLKNTHIHSYVPCETPSFLFKLASSKAPIAFVPDVDEEAILAREGAPTMRWHLRRERNPKIIADKRRQVLAANKGKLACSVCTFDFQKKYGKLGNGFCEVHHLRPLADAAGEIETRLADLAVVCSNCHRMIHRSRPFLTLEQLRSKISI